MPTTRLKNFILQKPEEALMVLGCWLLFIGFTCSRALMSIAMFVLFAAPFIRGQLGRIGAYFQLPEYWVLSFYFLIVFASGIYSSDKTDWLNWVRIKLPYLALPVAFAALQKIEQKNFLLILYGFLLTFFCSTCYILLQYYLHFKTITESFSQGSALNIPFSHIRYSLMLTFAFFCAVYLWRKKLFVWSNREKYGQMLFAFFAFIALHIFSVRSGLLALYLGLIYLAIVYIIQERKIIFGFLLIAFSLIIPFAAYYTVPSLHNKINYMRYDLMQFTHGTINNYNDAMRLASIRAGLKIWEQNIWLGCGAGDLKNECAAIYRSDYPGLASENYRLPHNQFVWVMATTGILGFSLFLVAFFLPIIRSGIYKNPLAVIFALILFSSFFTEHTLEEQMGTGFYLIFLLLLINRWEHAE